MKMYTSDNREAQIQGVQSKAFGLQLNAKVYDMLINKLYQNKAGAVIRELFANAWDSHVEAGNTDMPIEIHMPSWLDQNFGIRDYGTGIPHDTFEDIYTNVGSSTKEHTNELIGGYGIGSKAPFTLTDTFLVENWYHNRKTTWLCFKSNGTPEVSKVGDEPSDEPSGLQCSFSFDSEETVQEFIKELPRQLMFFPVKPLVTGGSTGETQWVEVPKYESTDTYFFMGKTNIYGSPTHYVVMGNVRYPFTTYDAGVDNDYTLRPMFESGKSLVLLAPLGSVDIPPSRENLELTERTKKFIQDQCKTIMQEYVDTFIKEMGTQSTILEARKYVHNANTKLVNSYMVKCDDLKFADGTSISWTNLKTPWFKDDTYTMSEISKRYKNVLRSTSLYISKIVQDNYLWYINDIQVGGIKHINSEFNTILDIDPLKYDIIVKPQDSYSKATFAQDVIDCKAHIEKTYGVTATLLSDVIGLPAKAIKAATGIKVEADQIFNVDSCSDEYDSIRKFTSEYTETTFPITGYYIELKGWQAVGYDLRDIKKKINVVLSKTSEPVYFVRSKSIKKLGKNVKPFEDLIELIKPIVLHDVEQSNYIDELHSTLSLSADTIDKILKIDFPLHPEYTLLKRYVSKLKRIPTPRYNASNYYEIIHGVGYLSSTNKTTFKRTIPSKVLLLSKWFEDNASSAFKLIENTYYYGNKEKAYKQLNTLING